ncbi:MAG: hydrophobe/amphiphile efflux-3 (HAE3) family transporter [Limnochordales bacterium]
MGHWRRRTPEQRVKRRLGVPEGELSRMRFLSRIVQQYPGWIIAVVLLTTAFFAYGALHLTFATDVQSFFPENDPRLVSFKDISDTFGYAEYVLAVVSADDVFTVPVIEALDGLTRELERVPGVASVRSLTNVEHVRGTAWGIEVARLMEALPRTEEEVAAFRERVLGSDSVAERFVSEDERHTIILVQLGANVDRDATVRALRDVVRRYSDRLEVRLTGGPALVQELNDLVRGDLARLTVPVIVVIIAVLYFSFRSAAGVLLPLASVGISVVWAMGLMGYLGVSVSQLGSAIPVVLTSIGSAYGIHVLRRFDEEWRKTHDSRRAAEQTVRSVGVAVIMSGLTTVVGFLANVFTSIVRIREFGLFMALGVLVALLVSLLFIPAVLVITRSRRAPAEAAGVAGKGGAQALAGTGGKARRQQGGAGGLPGVTAASSRPGMLERLGRWVTRHPAVPIAAGLAVAALSLTGFARLEVDNDYIRFFDKRSETRQAYQLVQQQFGGVETVQIVLEGDVLEPAALRAMEALQKELDTMPLLSGSMSVADLVKEVGRALNEDDPAYAVIPDTRPAVAQYLLLLSFAGDALLDQFLTPDQTMAKIEVSVATTSAKEREELLARIEELAHQYLDGFGRVVVTGVPFLMDRMAEMITSGQIQSLARSVLGVLVLLWIMVRSLGAALLCLVPILLTIVINFGVMGWADIKFDIVTALIASVVVGVGIDYSIHVYSRYREEVEAGRSAAEAVVVTLATTGRAVLLNAAAVATGLLVLLLSAFPPLRIFGALTALTMGVASAGAMTVLTALLVRIDQARQVRRTGAAAAR